MASLISCYAYAFGLHANDQKVERRGDGVKNAHILSVHQKSRYLIFKTYLYILLEENICQQIPHK